MADFKSIGKIPLARELLTISIITGVKVGRMSQRMLVGIRSSTQDVFDDFLMTEAISESIAGMKDCNFEEEGVSKEFNGGHCKSVIEVSIPARTVRIFDIF